MRLRHETDLAWPWRALLMALGAALALTPSRFAYAEGAPPTISWEAPPGCPDEAAVRAAVRVWLGEPLEGLDPGSIHIVARVEKHPAGWKLELSIASLGGHSQESLVAERCETLVDVVALKAALAANPSTLLLSIERKSEKPAAAPASPPPRSSPSTDSMAFGVRAALGGAFGPLPGFGEAVAVVGSVELSQWRVELGAGYWFPRSARYPSRPTVGAELALLAGTMRVCWAAKLGLAELPICSGIDLGTIRGTGFGTAEVGTSDQAWGGLVLGPALRWPLDPKGRISLWAEADAVVSLTRPRYHFRNLDLLYRAPLGAVHGWLGVELRFE